MKNTFLKSSCLFLLVVVAFVYFANPIYAKASTADMDYIETDMTTSEVAELFAVPAAFLPAALVIIGFIVLTYCTLRNVQVPVSYSSQTSFLDKCTQLGQYVIDNATDPIKNFLYSVYTYAQDNNLTSVTGISAFTAVHIGLFFHAISQWIGGSLINNVSSIGEGLLSSFAVNELPFLPSYDYSADLESVFNPVSSVPFSNTIGVNTRVSRNVYYSFFTISDVFSADSVVIYISNNRPVFGFYCFSDGYLYSTSVSYGVADFFYANDYFDTNIRPNLSSYSSPSITYSSDTQFGFSNTSGSGLCYSVADWLPYLLSLGLTIYFSSHSLTSSMAVSSVDVYQDVITPWADQIYQPADDELEIDPDGVGEVLGGAVAGLTLGELINLLTQGKTLTLDSALESQKIVGGGDYVFPSMEGIWKYPQYFFDMLKGWGSFVGGCLSAVTVGDGGLSWIFYGGFVLLICGGIIGKILLG